MGIGATIRNSLKCELIPPFSISVFPVASYFETLPSYNSLLEQSRLQERTVEDITSRLLVFFPMAVASTSSRSWNETLHHDIEEICATHNATALVFSVIRKLIFV